jgi:hypothetical protein
MHILSLINHSSLWQSQILHLQFQQILPTFTIAKVTHTAPADTATTAIAPGHVIVLKAFITSNIIVYYTFLFERVVGNAPTPEAWKAPTHLQTLYPLKTVYQYFITVFLDMPKALEIE